MKHSVSLVKCQSYDDAAKAVLKSVELLGGWGKFVKKGDRVLLKVNGLGPATKEQAVTTHPAIVAAVIDQVRAAGGIPSAGDSPAVASFQAVAEKSGIAELCKKKQVGLTELRHPEWKRKGKIGFPLSTELDGFDTIINMPKLKTHMLTVYTGAVKNMFGCIPGTLKSRYHFNNPTAEEFSSMLLDLHEVIKPKLTIMDAVIGMDGFGPGNGRARKCGLVIAGTDSLALDTVAVHIVKMENKVPMMHIARRRQLPQSELANITVKGLSIGEVLINDFRRPPNITQHRKMLRFAYGLAEKILDRKPVIMSGCIACGDCEKICPAKAIKVTKMAEINYKKCIKCFCCHEACRHNAIGIKSLFGIKMKA